MYKSFLILIVFTTNGHSVDVENIIGSLPGNIVDYPYQVAILQHDRLWCTGSIATKRQVLTTANCLADVTTGLVIYAGTSFWLRPRSIHYVIDYIKQYYNSNKGLAVLTVDRPFTFDITRQPVKLPSARYELEPGTWGNITGWMIGGDAAVSSQLLFTKAAILDREICDSAYSSIRLSNGEFCVDVYGDQPNHSTTGGPIVINGHLVGVVQDKFGLPTTPTIYYNIMFSKKWIKKHLIY